MRNIAAFLITSLFLISCKHTAEKKGQLFTVMPPSYTHVNFKNQLTETEQSNIIEYLYFNNGGGVAAGDINNDGLVDLFFTSNQKPDRLYLNLGNFKFRDITEEAGIAGIGDWKTGVTMADVNGDGLLDIYVCEVGKYKNYHGRNQLFINQGNLKFKDEAHEYGLDFQGFSTQAAFFDYDLDGDLDMYLLNHSVHTSRSYGNASLRFDRDSLAGGRLFRNDMVNGRHVFHNVTNEAGIYSSQIGYGLGVNICDINNDGYPDIYVSNDFHENDYLYINNHDGTFTERLTDFISHTCRSSMGNDVGDINNDGLLDIMVLDMLPDNEKIRKQSGGEDDYELASMKLKYGYNHQFVRNTLQLNLGDGKFSEIGQLAGVYSTDWSWSPLICDVDNDGWKDIFISSGIYRRANDLDYVKFLSGGNKTFPAKDLNDLTDKALYEKMPLYKNLNYIFRNNHDYTFTNMDKEWGLTDRAYSNGATYADLDNDGDLDIIVNNINDYATIYRNNSEKSLKNHYISIKLKGSELNTSGIGSRVTLYSGGQKQIAEQSPTRGFISATSDILHFGLGNSSVIDSIMIRWPGQKIQTLKNIKADQTITLDIANAALTEVTDEKKNSETKLFTPVQIPGLKFSHREDGWVDFYREKLIPHSLSAEGPAIAVGDVNRDGLQDLFIGGAKNQAAQLFIQQKDGTFRSADIPILRKEIFLDDIDAAFFDANGDGYPDLYIVRGGNEIPAGNPLLCDLLLINDGKGGFVKGDLPYFSHNGSCVRPCDFDGDGDIDLFVGSRSIPGAYGLSAEQYLLENDGHGHFKIVNNERTKAFKNIGMVTDAAWIDYNRDGINDLVIAGEWMKISLFRNDKGTFTDITHNAGLDETSGWWNCLNITDIDGDGYPDIIAGNLGLNSMLRASVHEPVEMYLNDFDNNGSLDQIICSYHDGVSYPFASFDELSSQISGLLKEFPHYSDFGGKTVRDIFGKDAIDHSIVKKAVLPESCIFMNNGNGTFGISKLPAEAQFSQIRGIIARDVDSDGKTDIVVAGNDYAVRPSYGRYDASYGWCLLSDQNKNYHALTPVQSGLNISGDARKLVSIDIKGKHCIAAAVNNGDLQIFQVMK